MFSKYRNIKLSTGLSASFAVSSFISMIDRKMDWSKHQSRMSISREKATCTLEQAITDYSPWNEVFYSHRTDLIFDRYVDGIRKSQQYVSESLYWYIQNCMEIIHDSFSEHRNEDRLHYQQHVLLMVIMIAKQYGCQNAQDIADFYNILYLEHFITLPRFHHLNLL